MSRIGKHPVALPEGVTVSLENDVIKVKGKLGELTAPACDRVHVKIEDKSVTISPVDETKEARAMWGTMRANLNVMVKGVTEGFKRKLVISGVGYKAQMQGNKLKLALGFSHDVDVDVPEGIKIACPSPTSIEISGIDKQKIGQLASEIRSYRGPEPYKGKGVKYEGEHILRKEGKKK